MISAFGTVWLTLNLLATSPSAYSMLPCTDYVIKSKTHKICWTFDDHPCQHTREILALLKQYNLRATFFVVGWPLHYYYQYKDRGATRLVSFAREIHKDGHLFGNHSLTHANLCQKSRTVVQREIKLTQRYYKRLLGIDMKLWRPPHAVLCRHVQKEVALFGLATILYDVSDYGFSAQQMLRWLERRVVNGKTASIVLMHHWPKKLRFLLQNLTPARK